MAPGYKNVSVEAAVVSKSRNKVHQTWISFRPFLYINCLTTRRALGRREVREEARAAKHVNAKQAHSKQPGPLRLLHLMRSCDPEKKPDFILLI